MLATILRSPAATKTTISIIETFAKIRELGRNLNQLSNANTDIQKKNLMHSSGELITELFGNDLDINESETTIELNFAVLKLKHTIKAKKK